MSQVGNVAQDRCLVAFGKTTLAHRRYFRRFARRRHGHGAPGGSASRNHFGPKTPDGPNAEPKEDDIIGETTRKKRRGSTNESSEECE